MTNKGTATVGLGQLEHTIAKQTTANTSSGLGRAIGPLELWNPPYCGEMDLCIKANGEWWHHGTRMTRQKLIDLLASVLWCEPLDGVATFYLKTPVEKIKISVEDAPLLVTQVESILNDAGQPVWRASTSTGDVVDISEANPLAMRSYQGNSRPYILIRHALWALVHRNSFYHLISTAEPLNDEGTCMRVYSGASSFDLQASDV